MLCVESYNPFTQVTTLLYRGPTPMVVLACIGWAIPMLFMGGLVRISDAKDWNDYDASWSFWHAKYGGFRSADNIHFLNNVQLPSESGMGRATCICGWMVQTDASDHQLLQGFQRHLDAYEELINVPATASELKTPEQVAQDVLDDYENQNGERPLLSQEGVMLLDSDLKEWMVDAINADRAQR